MSIPPIFYSTYFLSTSNGNVIPTPLPMYISHSKADSDTMKKNHLEWYNKQNLEQLDIKDAALCEVCGKTAQLRCKVCKKEIYCDVVCFEHDKLG